MVRVACTQLREPSIQHTRAACCEQWRRVGADGCGSGFGRVRGPDGRGGDEWLCIWVRVAMRSCLCVCGGGVRGGRTGLGRRRQRPASRRPSRLSRRRSSLRDLST
eukprot:2015866-Prymnesium_polylepis.1